MVGILYVIHQFLSNLSKILDETSLAPLTLRCFSFPCCPWSIVSSGDCAVLWCYFLTISLYSVHMPYLKTTVYRTEYYPLMYNQQNKQWPIFSLSPCPTLIEVLTSSEWPHCQCRGKWPFGSFICFEVEYCILSLIPLVLQAYFTIVWVKWVKCQGGWRWSASLHS